MDIRIKLEHVEISPEYICINTIYLYSITKQNIQHIPFSHDLTLNKVK